MGEIKSSWEIAREKVEKLGKLSPEEQRKQREDRCHPIGKSLAEKYLSEHNTKFLENELNKYDNEDNELIRQITLRHLIEEIDLNKSFLLDRIAQGILNLAETEEIAKTINKIEEISSEYNKAEEMERQNIERDGREILNQQRISGTAISKFNILAKKEWRIRLDKIAHPFKETLDNLKRELLDLTISAS